MNLDKRDFPGATFPEWMFRVRLAAGYGGREYGPAAVITADAGLHYLRGNSRPYFSVTGEIRTRARGDCDSCGCLHEPIAEVFPQLKPVIALHLSDDQGWPIHAIENGWYNLAGFYGVGRYHRGNSPLHINGQYRCPTPEECITIYFADHWRISGESALELAKQWQCEDETASKRWYVQWAESQRGRLKAEADAAIELLKQLGGK